MYDIEARDMADRLEREIGDRQARRRAEWREAPAGSVRVRAGRAIVRLGERVVGQG